MPAGGLPDRRAVLACSRARLIDRESASLGLLITLPTGFGLLPLMLLLAPADPPSPPLGSPAGPALEDYSPARQSVPLAALFMLLSSVFLVTLAAFVKVASEDASAMQAVLYRSLFSLLPLLGWMRARGVRLSSSRWQLLVLRGALGFAALFCYFYAVIHIELANALALQQLAPIFVGFLAVLLLGERPRLAHYLLAAVCLAGALLVIQPNRGVIALPAIAALLAALLSSGAYVAVRALTRTEPTLRIVAWFAAVAVVLSLPLVIPGWHWLSLRSNVLLIGAGLLAAPAQGFMTAAYARAEAHVAAAFSYANVPLAYLYGLLVWEEQPDTLAHLGIGLIVVGGVLLVLFMRPSARPILRL